MPISFDRFVALTAALAASAGALHGCSSDATGAFAPGGGSAGDRGAGESGAAGVGNGGGGNAGGGGATANGGASGAAQGGAAGSANAGGTHNAAGAGAGGATNAGGGASDDAGVGDDAGGDAGVGDDAGVGGLGGASGDAGADAGTSSDAGDGGIPVELCFGDVGLTDCGALPEGSLPSDECAAGPNPLLLSCYFSMGGLRPGALEALASCLVDIDEAAEAACSPEVEAATLDCERAVAGRACQRDTAVQACTTGLDLGGGDVLASPVANCTDGTLTESACIHALSTVTADALPEIAKCADPAGEYAGIITGTCAERLHECLFPHGPVAFYPWQQ